MLLSWGFSCREKAAAWFISALILSHLALSHPSRPLSQPTPYGLHCATDSDADLASGDSVSLARSISKDSLASNVVSVTPKHQLGGPGAPQGPRRVNGQSLLGHVNMEDEEEEELVAMIKTEEGAESGRLPEKDLELQSVSSRATTARSPQRRPEEVPAEPRPDSFFLEPLMPAVLKPAKEKSVNPNKEEECGEGRPRGSYRRASEGPVPSRRRPLTADHDLNQTFTPIASTEFPDTVRPPVEGSLSGFRPVVTSSIEPPAPEQPCGFFLHTSDAEDKTPLAGTVRSSPFSPATVLAWDIGKDSDSEVADVDEEEADEELARPARRKCFEEEEEESAKLREDMKVREHEDKEGASGRSSPCLSTISQASSTASGSVRMTSFAERRLHKGGHDARSSSSSSQKTTPDGSECGPLPLTSWKLRREQSPTGQGKDGANVLASELVQLHMQLEEKRRAIETQKKKMESLSARQRLKLGKAAFLNIVKKGKSDTLPQPLKPEYYREDQKLNGGKELSKDDSCVDGLRGMAKEGQEGKASVRWARESPTSPGTLEVDNKLNGTLLLDDGGPEPDLNECNRSIEMLNDAISAIQQQMMQLSLQQDLLMKQNIQSPPGAAPTAGGTAPIPAPANGKSSTPEPKFRPAVHFVEPLSTAGGGVVRRPPKLSSGRSRSKPTDLKLPKENGRQASRVITPTQSVETLPHLRHYPGGRTPREEPEEGSSPAGPGPKEAASPMDRGSLRRATFRLHDEANQRTAASPREASSSTPEWPSEECLSSTPKEREQSTAQGPGKEGPASEEMSRSKAHLIEVDLSDLKDPSEEGGSDIQDVTGDVTDGDQKSGLGFFFKVGVRACMRILKL